MKSLDVTGWKADNGFRDGSLSRILEALKREFPRTDLKISPNITSKISQWKKKLQLSLWNPRTKRCRLQPDYKIDCDNDKWEQIIRADKDARNMRFKSWPMWDAWNEIFGKDRAVDTPAADLKEMSKEVYSNGDPILESGDSEYVEVLVGHLLVPIPT
ncbi:uncharacterized protein LOC121784791 [Salvia splendens]|uniref:uncharacterized protein LOC121784791 n=1 Tax=Salvia splendens TaxID=180675 RepID=UPI001C275368|nr:uncharacterized protein LOC121784791 [Salvia splendens]